MTITKIPIWLDCDPGHDDAIAILLACFHPAFELLGISACYGNSSLENTDYNTRSLLTALGQTGKIKVYKGASKPWIREPSYAPDIHGASGLDGTTLLPKPNFDSVADTDYKDAIEKAIKQSDGQITIISTGSTTGVATLFKERPDLRNEIRYLSIMGGGFGVGNKNPNESAEFNIWVDPQAANFLFHDKILKNKIVLCPLNLTHTAIATEEIFQRVLRDGESNLRKLFYDLFLFFRQTYKDHQGFESGPPIHDPMTLFPLLELYGWESHDVVQLQYKRMNLSVVEDVFNADLGMTYSTEIFDAAGKTGSIVAYEVNIDYFWTQIIMALDRAELESTIEVG